MRLTIGALSLAAFLLANANAARAQSFGKFYALGDSLTDCCYIARSTNSQQPNWADQLPMLIGASYTPGKQTDFAIGGAQSGLHNGAPSLETLLGIQTGFLAQVGRFQAAGLNISSRDVAGIWIGTNDIWPSALPAGSSAPAPIGGRPDVAALSNYITGNVRSGINTLVASGIRNIVLITPYDMSKSSIYQASFGVNDATTLSLASQYSIALRNQLATLYTPGVNTYFFDTLTLLNRIQANPSAYGFSSHVTSVDSCSASPSCASAPVAVQNTYVFNDIIHTTSGFDLLMSRYISNVINAREAFSAPGDISQGAARAFSTGLIDRLDAQRRGETPFNAQAAYMPTKALPAVVASPADKFSVFVDGTGAGISRSGGPTPNGPSNTDLSTSFAGITIGADYKAAPNLRVGGAFNFLNSSTDLPGLSKTHIDSNSFQGGLFASLSYPHFFFDAAATYGLSKLDTRRPGVIDVLNGSLDGNTFTVAGRTGYLFDVGSVKLGPIVEMAYSNVRLGAYSERGDDLLTLGVLGQNFDSLTGGAGAQLRASIPMIRGSFNPFINLTAQHDFFGGVRAITSFSTDAPLLLINTTGGRPSSDPYGKVSGGFDVNLGSGLRGLLTASSTFGRSGGDDYSLNGGLQYQF